MRGTCSDSFGLHCAVAADLPEAVITRARFISECRAEGQPIPAIDADTEADDERERALASLVDGFLEFDFNAESAEAFFAQHADIVSAY